MSGSAPSQQKTVTQDTQKGFSDTTGTSNTSQATAQNVTLPDWLQGFIQSTPGLESAALGNFATNVSGYQIPQESLDALRKTASGDYLFGGPGQQAFIDAAGRAAMPGIYSQFGGAGRGGSGLEDVALNQAYTDAFANLFNQERGRQLQAAQLLPGITALPLGLQQQLVSTIGGIPSQFASLFGQSGTATSTGTTTQSTKSGSKGTSTTTQPVYNSPWYIPAIGGVSALAGLAKPNDQGVSAGGNILSGLSGLLSAAAFV